MNETQDERRARLRYTCGACDATEYIPDAHKWSQWVVERQMVRACPTCAPQIARLLGHNRVVHMDSTITILEPA